MIGAPYPQRFNAGTSKPHGPIVFCALGLGILLLLILSGCSALGVVETSDPYQKLAQAEQLKQTGRIGVARRLILEAAEIFEQQGDAIGLAEAYRSYGFLLRMYGEDVITDLDVSASTRTATNYDRRMDKSIEYFQKSLRLYKRNDQHDRIANLHYNIGVSHHFAGRLDQACFAFDTSLEAHRASMRIDPGRDVVLPSGVESFAELINRAKEEIGCRD